MNSTNITGNRLATHPHPSKRRNLIAGAIGNAIEFYDFIIYAYLAQFFAAHFFPSHDPVTGLIATYGGFAAGMLMRPIGGMVIGSIGDRIGRNFALQLSVVMISIPTFLIGLLPTYGTIGIWAPVLLLLMRLIQGLSLGGEYSAAVVFLVERASPHQRGFAGSFSPLGVVFGMVLGSAVIFICIAILSPKVMSDWGWRVPFIASAFLTLFGMYIRKGMSPDEQSPSIDPPQSPVMEAFKQYWREMLAMGLANAVAGVMGFVGFMYVVTWMVREAGISHSVALSVNFVSLLLCCLFNLLAGKLSDQFGWRRTVMMGATLSLIGAWPAFMLFKTGVLPLMIMGSLIIALAQGFFTGPFCACMASLVPPRLRVTVIAFGFSASMGIFGGLSPMLTEYLAGRLGLTMAPALMIAGSAVISLLTLTLHPLWRRHVQRFPEDRIPAVHQR